MTAPGTPSTPGQGGAKARPSAFDLMYAALHGTAYFRIHGIGKSTVWAYARENPDHPLWVTYLDRGVPGVAALVAEMQRIALEEASANDPLYASPAPAPAAEVDAGVVADVRTHLIAARELASNLRDHTPGDAARRSQLLGTLDAALARATRTEGSLSK